MWRIIVSGSAIRDLPTMKNIRMQPGKTGHKVNLNYLEQRTSSLIRRCGTASVPPVSAYTVAVPMRKRIDSRGRKQPAFPVSFGQNVYGIRKKPSFVRWLTFPAEQGTALPLRIG